MKYSFLYAVHCKETLNRFNMMISLHLNFVTHHHYFLLFCGTGNPESKFFSQIEV